MRAPAGSSGSACPHGYTHAEYPRVGSGVTALSSLFQSQGRGGGRSSLTVTFMIPFQLSPVDTRNNVRKAMPKLVKVACLLRPSQGLSSLHSARKKSPHSEHSHPRGTGTGSAHTSHVGVYARVTAYVNWIHHHIPEAGGSGMPGPSWAPLLAGLFLPSLFLLLVSGILAAKHWLGSPSHPALEL